MGTESGLRRRVKGLSEAEFRARFGTEEACRAALFQLRWSKGWVCPSCGHGRCAELWAVRSTSATAASARSG